MVLMLKISNICKAILLGLICLITSFLIIVIDPIHTIVNYNLRLRLGSYMYNMLQTGFKGAQLSVYMFNITNGDRFMSGDDEKLRVQEVGPFVFQEFHWYEDLEESEDGRTLAMTPKYSSEFVPELSLAHPRDINLTLPNLAMLSAATLMAPYPGFIRYMFNTMASQLNAKAIINIDVHNYLWGYKDPLISLSHNFVPGLIYFDSIGLLDRFYDKESDYRMVVGATNQDRFQIKSVRKYRRLHKQGMNDTDVTEQIFPPHTYEGIGYPPDLTPDAPINWYRLGVCKTFELEYKRTDIMESGGEGQVYDISSNSFRLEQDPTATKVLPEGLIDISKCYYDLPYVVSKPHFMDSDPKLLAAIDGLKPDKELHKTEIMIDRRIGITFHTQVTTQMSIVLDDVTYNWQARRLANTVIPIIRFKADQLKMSTGTMIVFYLVYYVGPYSLFIIESVLIIIGLIQIAYAMKSIYCHWVFGNESMRVKTIKDDKLCKTKTKKYLGVPLII